MKRFYVALVFAFTAGLAACDEQPPRANDKQVMNEHVIEGHGTTKVIAEIWVDNWFAMSVNGSPLIEDSVPFKTERSFNAERVTFSADLPATVAFEFRDFRENDTGLEYIGTGRQQVGDGGAIVQFTDAETGAVLNVSDSNWKCLVINHAPVDEACAKESNPKVGEGLCAADITDAPFGFTEPDFDDSLEVDWKPRAKLIWSDDLKLDSTVLCRTVIGKN